MAKSHVFHRNSRANYPVAVRGEGVYIYDKNGKQYLDGCGGAAVSCLGHDNADVRQAMIDQINNIAYAHTGFFTNDAMEQLADYLCNQAPGDIDKAYFVSGGSEAVESAIKLARQYFLEQGKTNKRYVIARWQSYHGNTLGALSAGGNRWRRMQFEPLLVEMAHITPCYEYRYKEDEESSYEFGQRVANELEHKIQELGADNVMAFMAEPVVGATMGCVPAVEGYFKRIREICDKYDVLLILDEIMCGMGRTGTRFAYEQEGAVPDILTLAKSLGGGYQPIGAMMTSSKIHDVIKNGSGFFQHGHTYLGHATACAAALAVQQYIDANNLLENVVVQGNYLQQQLKERFLHLPYVGDVRGKGLFQAIELVVDKETKSPFDTGLKLHAKIKAAAMENGLMCYPMGGTVDGKQGDHIMFAPPFVINQAQVDDMLERFDKAFSSVMKALGGGVAEANA
jgi:hypothetical protein